MNTQEARIVNTGLDNEPHHYAIQELNTNKVFEFSKIKKIIESDNQINELSLEDNSLEQETIQRILNNSHTVNISWDENDEVTLHF